MTKDETFKRKTEASYYYFEMRDFNNCLKELIDAGAIILSEIKREEEKRIKKTNRKLL